MQVTVSPVSSNILIEVLRDYLPYSLSLFRRLQFAQKSQTHSVLATTLPQPKSRDSTCFAAAYVERARDLKTECWLFLSCESKCDDVESDNDKPVCANCTENCLAVVREIAILPAPPEEHGLDAAEESAKFPTHTYDPNLVLIGDLHTPGAHILHKQGWLSTVHPGLTTPYLKYIFERESVSKNTTDELPKGLRWGHVREQDFDLVQARTWIPRLPSALRVMPSIAVFPTPSNGKSEQEVSPIAWAFLAPDGSLGSLHVEDEFRGRGLAKKVAANLFQRALPQAFDVVGEKGGGYAHANVAQDNDASRGVCTSIGGRNPPGWVVYWVRVDLEKVRGYPLKN